MKNDIPLLLLLILIATLGSCCFASQKCDLGPRNFSTFKILDQDGKNLLSGASKKYNGDSIQAYSLSGTDTVKHSCQIGPNAYDPPANDSFLAIEYDDRLFTTVFLVFDAKDKDTLQLIKIEGGDKCCRKYFYPVPVSFNLQPVQQGENGVFTIVKKL
ncbi:MAG: hypothetical protein WC716_00240 [Chitinophagaceae bacterium]|jgi:hypothetical protein